MGTCVRAVGLRVGSTSDQRSHPDLATDRDVQVDGHKNGNVSCARLTIGNWRFESNGYPRELLHAVDLRYPSARSVDATFQAGRSSAEEVMKQGPARTAARRTQGALAHFFAQGYLRVTPRTGYRVPRALGQKPPPAFWSSMAPWRSCSPLPASGLRPMTCVSISPSRL